MDPFDELTRVGPSASPMRQDRGPVLQANTYRTEASPQRMQNAAPAVGGNPFVDIPPQAAATPPRARVPRASAFQVCHKVTSVSSGSS